LIPKIDILVLGNNMARSLPAGNFVFFGIDGLTYTEDCFNFKLTNCNKSIAYVALVLGFNSTFLKAFLASKLWPNNI